MYPEGQAQYVGCPPLCMSYSVALKNWLKRKRSNLRSANEPPYVIFYRLLIHMEAVRVIFGQIHGDYRYINFTMAAAAPMLIFLARFKINHHIGFPTV